MRQNTDIEPRYTDGIQADAFRDTIQEFFQAVEKTLRGDGALGMSDFFPRAELSQHDGGLKLTVELPGMTADDVKVTVQDRTVIVEGEKREEIAPPEGETLQTERRYGSFYRMFTAPFTLDPEALSASFQNGVLTLEIPKPADVSKEAKTIPIRH